jgi:hypothetical protein
MLFQSWSVYVSFCGLISCYFRSCQVISGEVMLGQLIQVRPDYFKLGPVVLGYFMLVQAR